MKVRPRPIRPLAWQQVTYHQTGDKNFATMVKALISVLFCFQNGSGLGLG